MTTYTVIRREQNDFGAADQTPTSITQSGSGKTWSISGSNALVDLSNTSPSSKTLKASFNLDFRTADSVYNIPADRCIVEYNGVRAKVDLQNAGIGIGVSHTNNFTFGPALGGGSSSTGPFLTDVSSGSNNFTQTGSAVTTQTANVNDLPVADTFITTQLDTSNSNSNGLHQAVIRAVPILDGPYVNRKWEANNIFIDGVGNDTIDPITSTATIEAIGTVTKFAESDITSTATITDDSVLLKFGVGDVDAVATISFTPTYIADSSRSLSVITELLASTDNLVRLDPESYSSDFSFTVSPTFKIQGDTILAAEATDSIQGNAIYDIGGEYTWNTINAIAIAAEEKWDDKDSWETWLDNVWDTALETWDEWDQDVWARAYNIAAVFTRDIVSTFKPTASSNISASTSVTALAGLNEPAEADLTATVTTSFTANGIIDVDCVITDAFTPTLVDTVIFDQPSVIAITGAFTPVLTAAIISDQDNILSSSFAIDITPTHRRGPYQLNLTAAFTQPDTVPSRRLGPYQFVLPALASQLTTAKLFYQADPYNIFTVPAETRTAVIPRESNITLVDQEIRVNKVAAETRLYIVDQETRRFKLRVAPISNRFSTPKERAEA